MDIGGTLNVLFGNGQAVGGEQLQTLQNDLPASWTGTPAQLTALQNGLTQQSQTLSDIGGQLSAVSVAVGAISNRINQIQELLKQIQQEGLFQSWQMVDVTLTGYRSAISTGYSRYGSYVGSFSDTDGELVASLVQDILNVDVGPEVGVTAIHNLIMDDDQSQGVLQLWSAMVTPLVSQGLMDYREAVQQYENYYKKLAYAQLCGTNLLMEGYNYVPTQGGSASPGLAIAAYQSYRQQLLAQEDTFIRWLVPLVAAGAVALQLNPGVQRLGSTPSAGSSFFVPSPVFKKAEELLATLVVSDPADRRVVVHMGYFGGLGIASLVSGVTLTLRSTDGETTVTPVTQAVLAGPYLTESNWFPDSNFDGMGGLSIKRFVFSADESHNALVDTEYQLANLNGSNNLIPMSTYVSGEGNRANAPFMNDDVLAYTLQIGGAQPFDFMNFLSYSLPITAPGSFT
jgi:hypothetical protein